MFNEEVMKVEGIQEEADDIIELVNEDGEKMEFFHLATLQYEENWYVFFQPAEEYEDVEEDELVIFKLEANGDEDVFVPIEDEKLLDKVYDEYVRLMQEEGCDCDDDCDCEEGKCDCKDGCSCSDDDSEKKSCGCKEKH